MTMDYHHLTRRHWLAGMTAAPLACSAQQAATRVPKIAVVFTEFRFRSHTYNILENCLEPYLFNGKLVSPRIDVVSFYANQFPDFDMARKVARELRIPLMNDIRSALTLGGDKLAVDGVLIIGEHGEYPVNELGQKMYPRKEFFDQCVRVMKSSNRFVPVFNDKHLSYRWDWAKEMYDVARANRFPLMAGSSVPLAQRVPPLDLSPGEQLVEAVSVHGGGMESYDFHALEVLQSIVEARKGGESGVVRLEMLTGQRLKSALNDGRWTQDLAEAALNAERKLSARRQPFPRPGQAPASIKVDAIPKQLKPNHALCLEYTDGFKATVLQIGNSANRWNFACRTKAGKVHATSFFNGPWGNRNLFKALANAIQDFFVTGNEPYPVERTLLVSGILERAMISHQRKTPIATPELKLAYQPKDFRKFRESGATWKIITPETRQPTVFAPGDADRQ